MNTILGKSEIFEQVIGQFAFTYGDRVEKDYNALVEAVRQGRIEAVSE